MLILRPANIIKTPNFVTKSKMLVLLNPNIFLPLFRYENQNLDSKNKPNVIGFHERGGDNTNIEG